MARINLAKQTEKSTTPGSIVTTNATNEQQYTPPGANGTQLTIVAGVPTYVAPTTTTFFNTTTTTTAVVLTGNLLTVAGQAMTVDVSQYVGATAGTAGVAGLVNPAAAGQQDYHYRGDGTWELVGSDYKTLWQVQPYQGVFVGAFVGVLNSADLYSESYTNTNSYPVLVELDACYQMNLIYSNDGSASSFDARIITYTNGTPNRWGGNLYQFLQIDDDGRIEGALNRDYVMRGISDCILTPGASCTFTAQLNLNTQFGLFNTQARALYGSLTVTRLRSATTI